MVNRRRRGSAGKLFTYTEELKRRSCGSIGVVLDSTLEPGEEIRFRKRHLSLTKRLMKELPFTQDEIESLLVIYYKFQKEEPHLKGFSKARFKELLHECFDITSRHMKESISYVLDKSPSPYISMENWVRAMAIFLRGTFEQKVHHCFNVYDMMAYGYIGKDRMFDLLGHSVIEEDAEDVIRDLVELISKKLDKDRDGQITYDEFKNVVYEQPLLMECLGQCLPTRVATTSFLVSFTPYIGFLFSVPFKLLNRFVEPVMLILILLVSPRWLA